LSLQVVAVQVVAVAVLVDIENLFQTQPQEVFLLQLKHILLQ
jgi:hypothetical protein